MPRKTRVCLIHPWPTRQGAQTLHVLLKHLATTIRVGIRFVQLVTPTERRLEQVHHLLRKRLGRAGVLVQQATRAPQRMVHTLLMGRIFETLVGRKTIVGHVAGPTDADDFSSYERFEDAA